MYTLELRAKSPAFGGSMHVARNYLLQLCFVVFAMVSCSEQYEALPTRKQYTSPTSHVSQNDTRNTNDEADVQPQQPSANATEETIDGGVTCDSNQSSTSEHSDSPSTSTDQIPSNDDVAEI